MIDIIKNSIGNISRKKTRSIITITGIIVGVISVVLISCIGEIGKASINSEIESFGIGSITISADGFRDGIELDKKQLEIIKGFKNVDAAVPIIMNYTEVYMRKLAAKCVVWGVDGSAKQVIALETKYGRQINKLDVAQSLNVCVVDTNVAQMYYNRDNIVGKTLKLLSNHGYEEFEVVGVVASGGGMLQGMMGDYLPSFVYLPYTTLQRVQVKKGFDQIAVKLKPDTDPEKAGIAIVKTLEAEAKVVNAYKADNIAKQKQNLNNILSIVTTMLSVIAGISLVVASLGVSTMMISAVHERTREIGIKKAIGAKSSTILFEFMAEAFFILLIGCIIEIGRAHV